MDVWMELPAELAQDTAPLGRGAGGMAEHVAQHARDVTAAPSVLRTKQQQQQQQQQILLFELQQIPLEGGKRGVGSDAHTLILACDMFCAVTRVNN